MRQYPHLLMALLLGLLVIIVTGCTPCGQTCTDAEAAVAEKVAPIPLSSEQIQLNLDSFDTIHRTIAEHHYDPDLGGLDWAAIGDSLRPKVEMATSMKAARRAMNQLIGSLGQSHFVIYPSDVYEDAAAGIEGGGDLSGDVRRHSHSGESGDCGLEVRVLDGQALVTSVWPESPAEYAGMEPGWEITHVGTVELAPRLERLAEALEGHTSADYVLSQSVMTRLGGDDGDTIAISALDNSGQTRDLELTLVPAPGLPFTMGNLPEVRVWTRQAVLEGDIGYFQFNFFMDVMRVMGDFNQAMNSWRDKPGVIIDLRGNPGGIGAMATGIAGWFATEKGQRLGTMIMRNGEFNFIINRRAGAYEGRLAVLIDGMSGSTSEIFAGGMKDLGLARLFGTRTAGAALPSLIIKLPNGDGFQYAVANYISEGGDVLEGNGVTPHVEIVPDRDNLRTEGDPVLEAARKWLLNPTED